MRTQLKLISKGIDLVRDSKV